MTTASEGSKGHVSSPLNLEKILKRFEQAFCLCILFFWILERGANGWWPVAILICLPHLPAALPLPLMTYVRLRVGWRRGGWLLLGWLLWLGGSGYCLNWQVKAKDPLRVASYNLEGCPNGMKESGETLRALHADLYALQEVTMRKHDFRLLEYSANDGEFLCFSRYPIVKSQLVELQSERFSRPCQVVDITTQSGPLRVINVHFSLLVHGPQWLAAHASELRQRVPQALTDRRGQIANLLPLIQGRCLIAGDFNSQPRDNCLRELEKIMADSFRDGGLGWGLSFESTLPALRIDYIWHSRQLDCLQCFVFRSLSSDHLPVVADFAQR